MKLNSILLLAATLICGNAFGVELPGGPIGYMGDCQPVIGSADGAPERHPDNDSVVYIDQNQKLHSLNSAEVRDLKESGAKLEQKGAFDIRRSDLSIFKEKGRVSGYSVTDLDEKGKLKSSFTAKFENNGNSCVVKYERMKIGNKNYTVYDRGLCQKIRGGDTSQNIEMFERCKPYLEDVKQAVSEFNSANSSYPLAAVTNLTGTMSARAINPSGPDIYSLIASCFDRYRYSEEGERKPILLPTGFNANEKKAR